MPRENQQAMVARVMGCVFAAAGFIVMYLGWRGMAREGCVDCQMPYLLSGGAVGLGLVFLGVGLLVVGELRATRGQLADLVRRGGDKGDELRVERPVVSMRKSASG